MKPLTEIKKCSKCCHCQIKEKILLEQAQEFEKMIESFIERYQREGSSLYKDVGKHWLYTDELQELLKEVQEGEKELGKI